MNDQNPIEPLPELSAESITRIENAVFAKIAGEPSSHTARTTHAPTKRRRWLTGIGIAAAFVAGVLITPPILGVVGGGGVMNDASGSSIPMIDGGYSESAPGMSAQDSSIQVSAGVPAIAPELSREIIQNAQATLQVTNIQEAADAVAALADEHGGYVESTNIQTTPVEDQTSAQAPPDAGYGWVSIRVPSADLPDVITELASSGKVLASSVSKQDVTSTAIDLRARVDATRASVDRLTELMSNTATVSELIEAETALSDRQAQLESYEQQLAALDDQVAMSSLQVELTRTASATTADPAGFGDGLLAGWNGLIVSLNALVIAFGFLLPWLVVTGVVVLIVWAIRRGRRGRKDS
ncbi:hypothetical protein DC31_15235 [Microbacterium sp. CH12i]|uniref:DUF4349 domain-containing protein n=1 Tax=Microbacterium sp. CH12i TaxID=1479651 RepID=UPI0004611E43|nr:DUF4349 domain-containing protein [Microbacterium sp. CH12i]KDA05756.1 hypothetical protein DC31_15235 [Microbacterium sp. CH12i]